MKTKLFAALLPVALWGCSFDTHNDVNVKPIEIKPIHITIDVNVKVDRALDDFFDDVDNAKKAKAADAEKAKAADAEKAKTAEPATK